jgi:hypothetical protein
MVRLVTSDDVEFVVEKEVVERSVLIKNMLEGTLLFIIATHRSNFDLAQMSESPINLYLWPTFPQPY